MAPKVTSTVKTVYTIEATADEFMGVYNDLTPPTRANLFDAIRQADHLGDLVRIDVEDEHDLHDLVKALKGGPMRETVQVESFDRYGVSYEVTLEDGQPIACTCPHFQYRGGDADGSCKHIRWVIMDRRHQAADMYR